jgi:hypothetical protein
VEEFSQLSLKNNVEAEILKMPHNFKFETIDLGGTIPV